MTKGSKLYSLLCEELPTIPHERDKAIETFSAMNGWQRYGRDRGNLSGRLAEIDTLNRLEELRRRHLSDVRFFTLKRRTERGGYSFEQKEGGNIEFEKLGIDRAKREKLTDFGEVDVVVRIYGTPVIFETHLAPYKIRSSKKRHSVGRMLQPKALASKRKPIELLCGARPKIVYVVPSNHVQKIENPETMISKFVSGGGIILDFGETRAEWNHFIDLLFSDAA